MFVVVIALFSIFTVLLVFSFVFLFMMDYQDQFLCSSGIYTDLNPDAVKCLICKRNYGPNHSIENCPDEQVQQILSQRNNSAELPYQTQQNYFQDSC